MNDIDDTEMDAETVVIRLRHYAKLCGWELPGVLDTAADMIEDMIEKLSAARGVT